MKPNRPSNPMHVQALSRRHPCLQRRWLWTVAIALTALLLIWLGFRPLGEPATESKAPVSTAQAAGPPWQMGNPEGRFTLTLYADLECPFCRVYFPQLKRWVGSNPDVALQWHHQPLAAHEPAALDEARLAECAAEAGGHAAFWQAAEWIYAHTRSDGEGLPDGLRYPQSTPATEQCMASERADVLIRAQSEEATQSGVTATPSLRLLDRQTGETIFLQGPIEGDALLSAMDMLSTEETTAPPFAESPGEGSADISK